ncbi:MAG: radical SAM protein [Candidatus Marinimicrobia bacterium]|nr:radical SAM protein [Candidatus Neomarinimicrobiota bacterium]
MYFTPQRSYPLGLTYLAAAVKDLPAEVNIIDLLSGHGRKTIPFPETYAPILPYLPYDRSPIRAFHSYYHFGADRKRIRQYFTKHSYDVCAISSNFYTYSEEVLKTAEIIRSVSPGSMIVVGGQNAGPEHELFTHSPHIDICIQGEGEIPFRELIKTLLKDKNNFDDIPGMWNAAKQRWNAQKKPENISFSPDSGKLPPEHYRIGGKAAIMLSTSRGCPMACRFCSIHKTFGTRIRLKSVETVIAEMQTSYKKGIRAFDIEDDNFTADRDHCINLLNAIADSFDDRIELYAMNGISAEHLDEEIIDLLKRAKFQSLNLSIATLSDSRRSSLNRLTDNEKFSRIAHYSAKKGLKLTGHFIAGLPGQDAEEILSTMRYLSERPLILGISPFYYIPGMNMQVPNIPHSCKEARLTRFWPADIFLSSAELITFFRLSAGSTI